MRIVDRIRIAEGGICRNVYTMPDMPIHPCCLGKVRVQFHLVYSRFDFRMCDQILDLGGREVGDTNVSDFTCGGKVGHGVPGLWSRLGKGMWREGSLWWSLTSR